MVLLFVLKLFVCSMMFGVKWCCNL